MLSLLPLEFKFKFFLNIFISTFALVINLLSSLIVIPVFLLVIDSNYRINENIVKFINIINIYKLDILDFFIFLGIFSVLFSNLLLYISLKLNVRFQFNLINHLSQSFLKKYLNLKYEYYLKFSKSEIIKNINIEMERLVSDLFLPMISIFSKVTYLFVVLFPLFLTYPKAFYSSVFIILLFYSSVYLLKKKIILNYGKNINYLNKAKTNKILNLIENFKVNKIFGQNRFLLKDFSNVLKQWSNVFIKLNILKVTPRLFLEIFLFIILFSLLFLLKKTNLNKDELILLFATIGVCSFKILPAVQDIFNNLTTFRSNRPLLKNLKIFFKNLDMHQEEILKNQKNLNFKENIRIKNMSFSYNKDTKKVLKNINLNFAKNSKTGIYGESGSGKSTLIDIMCGLLKPDLGQVYIDNVPVTNENINLYQKKIGYISHNPYLINDTIKNNIILFGENEKFSEKKYYEAIRQSELLEFIEKSNLGDNKIIGDDLKFLSSGEAQRISLARTLYANKEIIFLDEFTSNLDIYLQNAIITNLSKIQNKTLIFVTHRREVLDICDVLIELKDGDISKK